MSASAAGPPTIVICPVAFPLGPGRWPSIRVLLISGYSSDTVLRDGDVAFLQKPFTPDALARKIREVLDG